VLRVGVDEGSLMTSFVRMMAVGLGLTGMAVLASGGCSASPDVIEDDVGGISTSGSTSTTTSGSGGSGGSGGATNLGPCGQDCSLIDTPQCLKSVCNDGSYPGPVSQCVVVSETAGVACDDGEFCTTADACDGTGICVGGPENDCGMAAAECNAVTCDEMTKSCSMQAIPDGTTCSSTDLCLTGTTCTAGTCGGGTTKDCFFEPVPDECHVSVCNPTNGMCEAIAGNEGGSCADQNDLCSVGNTCSSGVCGGGTPKDCSQLTQNCDVGVCDANNGQCMAMAVTNGQVCDDLDACTTGEICTNQLCGGGAPVTACTGQTADGCCPSSCTEVNDIDCACGLDKLRIIEHFAGNPDYIVISNPTTCVLELDPLEIMFDDQRNTDFNFAVPAYTMPANSTLVISDSSSSPPGSLYVGGNIPFAASRGGWVALCDGACSTPSNIIDIIAWEGGQPPPALPPGISFTPGPVTGVTSANESTTSHIRQAFQGVAPNFLMSDWTSGPKTQ